MVWERDPIKTSHEEAKSSPPPSPQDVKCYAVDGLPILVHAGNCTALATSST